MKRKTFIFFLILTWHLIVVDAAVKLVRLSFQIHIFRDSVISVCFAFAFYLLLCRTLRAEALRSF